MPTDPVQWQRLSRRCTSSPNPCLDSGDESQIFPERRPFGTVLAGALPRTAESWAAIGNQSPLGTAPAEKRKDWGEVPVTHLLFNMLQSTKDQGLDVLFTSMALLNQTFIFGAFSVLLPLSVYISIQRGQTVRGNRLLYCAIAMFLLSVLFWSTSLAHLVFRIQAHFINPTPNLDKGADNTFANAGVMLNFVITDGVVVSRAWTLCREETPGLVYMPLVSLVCTGLAVSGTIVLRVIISGVLRGRDTPAVLTRAIDGAQITSVVLTLLTNASATGLIAVKAWKHRKFMAQCLRQAEVTGNKGKMVLAFLVESGAAYCAAGIALLAAAAIRLPYGTLADLFFPAAAQLAGLYPTLILVIISARMSMNETTLRGAQSFDMDIALPPLSPAASQHASAPHTESRRSAGAVANDSAVSQARPPSV